MQIISDLHIHGKYSRACSKSLDIKNLEKYALIKGVNLLGTGDFQHPLWNKELRSNLKEDCTGILKTKTGFPFLLTSEVSLMYTQGGKGRRVHLILFAPDFATVEKITQYLLTKGRIDYDGRPIFKISCADFTEQVKAINDSVEIIPAHAWTPYFGVLGSESGFDSIKECFLDQTKNIHAIETGLSSDPEMNWQLKQLDNFSLVSFSDSHSFWPWRLGREATIFNLQELTYDSIIKALASKRDLFGTIEVDPNYGKYHFDGHRDCGVSFSPEESKKHNNVCPVCKKPLTIGVLNRVLALSDREKGVKPEDAKMFYKLIPLSEIISGYLKKSVSSQVVFKEYYKLVENSSELNLLLNMPADELLKMAGEDLTNLILKNRQGLITVKPGYDGEYGVPILTEEDGSVLVRKPVKQKEIFDF